MCVMSQPECHKHLGMERANETNLRITATVNTDPHTHQASHGKTHTCDTAGDFDYIYIRYLSLLLQLFYGNHQPTINAPQHIISEVPRVIARSAISHSQVRRDPYTGCPAEKDFEPKRHPLSITTPNDTVDFWGHPNIFGVVCWTDTIGYVGWTSHAVFAIKSGCAAHTQFVTGIAPVVSTHTRI